MKGSIKKWLGMSGIGILTLLSSHVNAAGYRLEFQSPSVLADAGEAAVVEDAGTNWYNSAGLVYLPQQITFSAIDVYAPTTFSGTTVAPSILVPVPAFTFTGVGRASSHPNNILPAIHYSLPISNRLAFGLSVVPAWGFSEDYGQGSILRYDLTRVYTRTVDISPSIAYKINTQWSVGLGPDFHYFAVQSRSNVRTAPVTPFDSVARFSTEDWGTGFHAGVLYRYDDATRIGLNYRSKILQDMSGHSSFIFGGLGGFGTHNFGLRIPLPPSTTLSAYRDVNPCWAVMGTLAYDQWRSVDHYRASNIAGPFVVIPSLISPQHMRNTLDVSVGTHYRLNDQILLRGSIKYEPTPTQSRFRDVNFPDGDKLGFQIGSRYRLNKCLAFDFIYGHVFVKKVRINGVNPLSLATATGHSRTSVDLMGGQVVWNL